MTLTDVIRRLRSLNQKVPRPLRLPTEAEVSSIETELNVPMHLDYRRYLLEASDVVFGAKEPATVTDPDSHTYLSTVCAEAWAAGVPKTLLPICEDNGDYYCVNTKGQVIYWSHDGATSETWPDLAAWIEQVWIGGSA